MSETIRCKYSCASCGLVDAEADVPMREDSQDVVVWLETICAAAISRDHDARSPECNAPMLKNLKIPIAGADYIGGPTKH